MPDFSATGGAISDETIKTFKKLFNDTVMNDKFTSWLADISYSWLIVLFGSFFCIILGYIYLWLISCMGWLIVWLSIFLIMASFIGGGAYVYSTADNYEEESDYRDWVKYCAYAIWGIAALYCCCICCCWNAIRIGIAVYRTTVTYVRTNVRIYLLPLVSYLIIGIWMTLWLVSLIYVWSVGTPEPREDYPFITNIKWEDKTRYTVLYQVFMLFWMNAFIMGGCQFIIAASACIWYFEVESDTQGKNCVGRAIKWFFRYHLGSVAFGSFIIALCQMLRFMFEYYRKKIESMTKNSCVRCLMCYTRYLLYLLE